jgi:glycogen operon protein
MLGHGDELGRTQGGNNNGFCHDDEITWINWEDQDPDLMTFTEHVAKLRAAHPVFRRRRFFDGLPVRQPGSNDVPDIDWYGPDGNTMTEQDWGSGFGKSVALFLNGQGIPDRDSRGQQVTDDSFVLMFNAHDASIDFTLPAADHGKLWQKVIDTADPSIEAGEPVEAQSVVTIAGRSLVVMRSES